MSKPYKDFSKTQFLFDNYGYLQTFKRQKQRALFSRETHAFIRFISTGEHNVEVAQDEYIKSVWRLIPNG
jgi:hypothetical protein